eukprot:GHVU01008307.1.p1 GENE.GHVU01008307.1~~GHVU01008307.1.p1  ORF type:complete len:362 (+),score=108.15 GHVU01008307.1:356-1441(+)
MALARSRARRGGGGKLSLSTNVIEAENLNTIDGMKEYCNEPLIDYDIGDDLQRFTILQAGIILNKPRVVNHVLSWDQLDINARSSNGQTALMICCRRSCDIMLLRAVLDRGAAEALSLTDNENKMAIELCYEDWPGYPLLAEYYKKADVPFDASKVQETAPEETAGVEDLDTGLRRDDSMAPRLKRENDKLRKELEEKLQKVREMEESLKLNKEEDQRELMWKKQQVDDDESERRIKAQNDFDEMKAQLEEEFKTRLHHQAEKEEAERLVKEKELEEENAAKLALEREKLERTLRKEIMKDLARKRKLKESWELSQGCCYRNCGCCGTGRTMKEYEQEKEKERAERRAMRSITTLSSDEEL